MVALNFIARAFLLSFNSFLVDFVVSFLAVTNQVTFHTEDKFQIRTFSFVVTERKSLHDTVVGNRQCFVSPFKSFLHQIFHRGQAVHLTHLSMAVELNALDFCIILAFRHIYFHNACRRNCHFVIGKTVGRNVALNTQTHPRLQCAFELLSICFGIITIASTKTHFNKETTRTITQVKGNGNITGTQFSFIKSNQLAVFIHSFDKLAFNDNAVFFLYDTVNGAHFTLNPFSPKVSVVFLFSVQTIISFFKSLVVLVCFFRNAGRFRRVNGTNLYIRGFFWQRNVFVRRYSTAVSMFHDYWHFFGNI